MNTELQLIMNLEKENDWFRLSFTELQKKFEKQFIAIKNGEVIENKRNLEDLIKALKDRKENPALLLIKYIHEKGVSIII